MAVPIALTSIFIRRLIMEEDRTGEEESQPTKKAVDEVTRIRLLINMEVRAIGTAIGNHLLKDSSA
jgi:hypothetical protein